MQGGKSRVFDDIELEWKGQKVLIPSTSVMGAIMRVEEVVTLTELVHATETRTIPLSRLAGAFAALLRYAGLPVTDEEVYAGIFKPDDQERTSNALATLLVMMVPPEHLADRAAKDPPRRARRAAASSSRKRSRRQ